MQKIAVFLVLAAVFSGSLAVRMERALRGRDLIQLRSMIVRFSLDQEGMEKFARKAGFNTTGYATPGKVEMVRHFHGVSGADKVDETLQSCGYLIGKTIGEGSYCKVKSASKVYSNGKSQKVACKIVNKRKASDDYILKFLPREVSIIRSIRHPNIVQTLDIIEVDERLFIFMDICEKGDLLDFVRAKGALSEHLCIHLFKQLVSAVDYLHSMDISHRDLKCENILMAGKDWVKLADFGFARWCRDQDGRRLLSDTFCGSAAYAAPEILQGVPYNPKMYDVWSLGCVLFIMLTATMPFDDSDVSMMLDTQQRRGLTFPGEFEVTVSDGAKRLIFHLLEPDVTRRATVSQVIRHRWLCEPCPLPPATVKPISARRVIVAK